LRLDFPFFRVTVRAFPDFNVATRLREFRAALRFGLACRALRLNLLEPRHATDFEGPVAFFLAALALVEGCLADPVTVNKNPTKIVRRIKNNGVFRTQEHFLILNPFLRPSYVGFIPTPLHCGHHGQLAERKSGHSDSA
jgi:hypothetical protein